MCSPLVRCSQRAFLPLLLAGVPRAHLAWSLRLAVGLYARRPAAFVLRTLDPWSSGDHCASAATAIEAVHDGLQPQLGLSDFAQDTFLLDPLRPSRAPRRHQHEERHRQPSHLLPFSFAFSAALAFSTIATSSFTIRSSRFMR